MKDKIGVSVIVPTYNGEKKLPGILKALQTQIFQYFELIIVVDGSTDQSIEVIERNIDSLNYRIVEIKNSGRSVVRNVGAKAAQGELLIFFDDDMRPSSDCISKHVEHHRKYPGSILTGAQIEEVTATSSDIFKYKAYLSHKWNSANGGYKNVPLTKERLYLTAANFSISKRTFDLLGGFDERLTDAEDYDLAVKASQRTIPLYVNLTAHAWHDDNITCASYIKRLRQYSKAHRKLNELKPELYSNNKFLSSAPKGLKRILFRFFAGSFWVRLIDQEIVFKVIPERLRYKLYDVIITANGVYFPDKAIL